MPTEPRTIPTDDRFYRWLVAEISRITEGSIQLNITAGKIRSIGCHNQQTLYSLDAPQAPPS